MTVFLFIDGTNFFAAQYELFGPYRYLNYSLFIKLIEKRIKINFDKIFFYASYTPRPLRPSRKEGLYLKNEFLFYKEVKKDRKTTFFKGYRSKTSGKEKEVDVKLSVDFVGYGLLNKFQKAYLFSGDADFLQSFIFLQKYKRNILCNLICLENRILYKGLYYYPSTIISFNRPFKKDVARKSKIIFLKKTAELCPRLG